MLRTPWPPPRQTRTLRAWTQACPHVRSHWGTWTTCWTLGSRAQSSTWPPTCPARSPPPPRPPGHPLDLAVNPLISSARHNSSLRLRPRPWGPSKASWGSTDQLAWPCRPINTSLVEGRQQSSDLRIPAKSTRPPNKNNLPHPSLAPSLLILHTKNFQKIFVGDSPPHRDPGPKRTLSCVLWRGREEAPSQVGPQMVPSYCSTPRSWSPKFWVTIT